MSLGEFELIQKYFCRATPGAVLGVGDDAALLAPTPGMQLAVAADTMVEGRHFFAGTDAYTLGWKVLAVNLSDMAAMGAKPRWITLCLTLPSVDEVWLDRFSQGLYALAQQHDVELVGGDTTRGPLTLSVQIIGEVAAGRALRRDGAQVGDDVWLSGATGAANLAVRHRYGQLILPKADLPHCASRLDTPVPRVALGRALVGIASAAIDVSDGLLADLGHIAERSGVSPEVELARLPRLPLTADTLALPDCLAAQLSGGDDYELCFTAAPSQRDAVESISQSLALPITRIGRIVPGREVVALSVTGQPYSPATVGFNHFRTP